LSAPAATRQNAVQFRGGPPWFDSITLLQTPNESYL